MSKFIKVCEIVNKIMKAVWPYLVALTTGAVIAGCAVEKLNVALENARTAGLDNPVAPSASAAAGAAAVQ